MFKCGKCKKISRPCEPMTKQVVEVREVHGRKQIVREVGVCEECAGVPFEVMFKRFETTHADDHVDLSHPNSKPRNGDYDACDDAW